MSACTGCGISEARHFRGSQELCNGCWTVVAECEGRRAAYVNQVGVAANQAAQNAQMGAMRGNDVVMQARAQQGLAMPYSEKLGASEALDAAQQKILQLEGRLKNQGAVIYDYRRRLDEMSARADSETLAAATTRIKELEIDLQNERLLCAQVNADGAAQWAAADRRANRLSDAAGELKTQNTELLAENATLRRRIERDAKRGRK